MKNKEATPPVSQPVTACIITYNEEENIRRCLESVKWVDEIVVVDSKSEDKTVEICREYTDQVILRDFPGHIEQKNFATDQATHDWVLSLDADEEVTGELKEEIEKILGEGESEIKGYYMPRKNDYLGEWATYGGFYPDLKLRLFHRDFGRWGGVNPHDHVVMEAPTGRLKGELLHYTYRDLAHHVEVINNFTTIASRQKYKKGVSLPMVKAAAHALGRFLDSYFLKGAVFHGSRGFLLAVQHGYYGFLKYAKVWELSCKEKKENSTEQ